MSYIRVVPRDLFNEANLLKCLGRLYIVTERFSGVWFTEPAPGVGFHVEQDDSSGAIFCRNVTFYIGDQSTRLERPLNSRASWPLYLTEVGEHDIDPVAVFTEDGELTPDMMTVIKEHACLR